MKRLLLLLLALSPSFCVSAKAAPAETPPTYYGTGLCNYPQYECIKIKGGQSWEKLFPDPVQRDVVQRLNRTYNHLWAGKVIAVPRALPTTTIFDISPF